MQEYVEAPPGCRTHAAMGAAVPPRRISWQIEVCNIELSRHLEVINVI
jgi:hypothetical protein